ncbi:DMT family transporter [Cellulomonas cellasea]|uniref:Inner membrane transporter RhtA n=1 Tax=Cellulomonas cellasea TaxID=43670 RepID=A0A7W4YC08_9CELL|nr:EamA family transporter [Cellulomonas cellasea]MBB2924520.1 inner membrane transporter RhtA [Cellulomonas cellasea]
MTADVHAGRGVPAPVLFLGSGLTQYLGAALAVGLFAVLTAPTVAWLRIAVSAVVLLAWRRPWRFRWTRADLLASALFGAVLAAMNVAFYVAIEVLPLGTAVAVEFAGPVAVAALTGRSVRERVAIAVAAAGVVLLAGVSLDAGPDAGRGLVAIGVSAVCWAGYILLGRRVAHGRAEGDVGAGGAGVPDDAARADAVPGDAVPGEVVRDDAGPAGQRSGGAAPAASARPDGVSSLAVAMTVGALVFAPFLAAPAAPVLRDPHLLGLVVGIAVFSSVVPYAIEQVVLRRVTAATFAVLLAMLPATAAVTGVVVLRQLPTWGEVAGLALVSVAIVLSARRAG